MDWKTCFQGKKILVVEDDSINRDLMQDILVGMGCEVDFANDGAQGVDKALATHYDLIMMDVRMPNKDGIQATREIRNSQGQSKDSPIIALTASTSDDEQTIKKAGMSALVQKPLNLEHLRQKMAEFLVKSC